MSLSLRVVPLVSLVLLAACAPAPSSQGGGSVGQAPDQAAAPRINRTLVMAGRSETPSVSSRPLRVFGLTSTTVSRLFNAGFALRDGDGNFHPYLAESLPQLNTETWRVSPDAKMETTYRLKQGLVWQDGAPVTADDWGFAYAVFAHPGVG